MESKIKTKYPPPIGKLKRKIAFLLRHKPTTQPALVTDVPHIRLEPIKPVCNSQMDFDYYKRNIKIKEAMLLY